MRKIIYSIALGAIVTGCAPHVLMVHPQTGDIKKCSDSGTKLLPAIKAYAYVENCVEQLEGLGYRRADELKPGEGRIVADSPRTPRQPEAASGTCFAVHPHGVLLTNHHVIEGRGTIRVRLADGTISKATVQKVSQKTDLAIIRINRRTPYFLPLARRGSVHVGDQVFTMGYPATDILGQEPKFTEGSVSALSGPGGEAALLQMSVPVQPGNSGGPLVNERGEVVGVVTSTAAVEAFLSETGTLPQNINWAVKADYIRLLFNAPTVKSLAPTRALAIEWTRRAICLVETSSP